MSQAEELLASTTDASVSTYTAESSSEPHIVIGKDRFITVPEQLQRIAVQYDHNIETVTFDCPRYWDGIDLSKMYIYINYLRADGVRGMYRAIMPVVEETVEDEVVAGNPSSPGGTGSGSSSSTTETTNPSSPGGTGSGSSSSTTETTNPEDEIIHFTWTISENVTRVKGPLRFLVCIKKTDSDGNLVNHWNSELNNQMYISEGLECEETMLSQYPDIIMDLLTRMDYVETIATPENMQEYVDTSLAESSVLRDTVFSYLAEHNPTSTTEMEAYVANYFINNPVTVITVGDTRPDTSSPWLWFDTSSGN